tara:strand:+ start:335 stop:511 length:177 start_codon:yes stop_codon:yes gene_type:complete
MEKSLKFKEFVIEYRNSVLIGASILLGLVALASTVHHVITLTAVLFLVGGCTYLLWRK